MSGALAGMAFAEQGADALKQHTLMEIGDEIYDSNAKDAFYRNLEMMNMNYYYNRELYQHRYQWMMRDMAKAGLNPILAAKGGFSTSGSPSVSGASMGAPGLQQGMPGAGLSASAKAWAEADKIQKETKNVIIERSRIVSDALKNMQQARQAQSQVKVNDKTVNKMEQEIQESQQRVQKMAEEMALINNQIDLMVLQMKSEKEEPANLVALRANLEQKTSVLQKELETMTRNMEQLITREKVYKGPLGQWITYAKEIFEALGLDYLIPIFLTRGLFAPKGKTTTTFDNMDRVKQKIVETPN